ncbi:calcium-binding protein [Thalassobius sp. I31.1]|uniref:calcium-binding protein n=1 Tax=Thalassobius sp. I31.1 TaxID=2109912 RepID=UPI000D1B4581|nr:calcium-binding protein [Thalassobius sp. I31.1]
MTWQLKDQKNNVWTGNISDFTLSTANNFFSYGAPTRSLQSHFNGNRSQATVVFESNDVFGKLTDGDRGLNFSNLQPSSFGVVKDFIEGNHNLAPNTYSLKQISQQSNLNGRSFEHYTYLDGTFYDVGSYWNSDLNGTAVGALGSYTVNISPNTTFTVTPSGEFIIDNFAYSFDFGNYDFTSGNVNSVLNSTYEIIVDLANPLGWVDQPVIITVNGQRLVGRVTINNYNQGYIEFEPTGPHCFPANTLIQVADGGTNSIEALRVGDEVLAFADGASGLMPARVVRLYENVTQEMIRLEFVDGRDVLHVTPGHAFLDEVGGFTKIGDLLKLGGGRARVIDADGSVLDVTGEWLRYSAETADLFEVATTKTMTIGGNLAHKEEVQEGWKTYNFEVEALHTYVAGGVRVHNDSGNFIHEDGKTYFDFHETPFIQEKIDLARFQWLAGDKITPEGAIVAPTFNGIGFDFVYSEGHKFVGEDWQPGGDFDGDGNLTSRDKTLHDIDVAERHARNARLDGNQIKAEQLERRAAELREDFINQKVAQTGGLHPRDRGDGGGGPHDKGKSDDRGGSTGSGKTADPNASKEGWKDKYKPIILDLDGNGVEITELSKSTMFVDATGDGLMNRTAWVGAGDGVLFYDPDGTGALTEKRQYVFTEWDPTATSDMEALASVFDENGDGVLDASDAAFANFKVLVTNADGSTTAKTLTQLGIVSIDLTADATNIELPDGSTITGKSTFTWADGTTGTVADTMLVADTSGHRVEKAVSTNAVGNRVETSTGYSADGSIAFILTAETSPDGLMITNSLDRNGDGVVDMIQTIVTVVNGDGSKAETVTNKSGANAATAVLTSQTVTSTSADGLVVTIERDSVGGGWFDQIEVRTTALDDSMTIVVTDRSSDGSTIRQVTETVSADGLTRSEAIDQDGDGDIDLTINHVIVVNPDGSRSETITHLNNDGSTRSAVTETVSTDGKVKTIAHDVDGDGNIDTQNETAITVNLDSSTSSTLDVKNGDGSLRSSTTHTQSDDALTKTTVSDVDGDGDTDLTTVDQTVINADGSRVNTVTATNNDGSINGMSKTTLGADKVSSQTWVDLNQNGAFEATDLVSEVTVDPVSGNRTAVSYSRNADGSINATQTSVTAADGLTTTTTIDTDGDGDTDGTITDVTVNNANGSTTRTVATRNGDNSLRNEVITTSSADGLSTTVETDRDGDGIRDGKVTTITVVNADGSTTTTRESFAGDGTTLTGRSVTDVSADRKVTTVTNDSNGDGHTDQTTVSTQNDVGDQFVATTSFAPDGAQISKETLWTQANGLSSIAKHWVGASTVEDYISNTNTVLLANGGTQTQSTIHNQDGSQRSWQQTTTSDDGLVQISEVDANWDGVKERTTTATTVLNADGSATTTTEVANADGLVMSRNQSEVSDDGLVQITRSDADGDGDYDLVTTSTTTLLNDGGRTTVTELHELDGTLRSATTSTTSDNGRQTTTTQDTNGDGNIDQQSTRSVADDGVVTTINSNFDSSGTLQSRAQTVVSANGLHAVSSTDADGNGVFEMTSDSLTVLSADGSSTTTLSEKSADGSIYNQTVTIISADGLTKTTTKDLDFDGTADLVTVKTSSLAPNGVETIATTTTAANGSVIESVVITVSADRQTTTEARDLGGDGNDDIMIVTSVASDGSLHEDISYLSRQGHDWATSKSIVSADGQSRIFQRDTDGDGFADFTVHSKTDRTTNGVTTVTAETFDAHFKSLGTSETRTSANGYDQTTILDLDGDGRTDFQTRDKTTFLENGETVRTVTTLSETMDVVSQIEATTSGDGLNSHTRIDLDGDGADDRRTDVIRGADGSSVTDTVIYDNAFTLQEQTKTTVSADGRTIETVTDADGDGDNDYRTHIQEDLNGNVTTTLSDLGDHGVAEHTVTSTVSANGMQSQTLIDTDGDGAADLTYVSNMTYDAAGNRTSEYNERAGSTLTYQETTVTSADGLSSSTSYDIDGDGIIDGSVVSNTTINSDGSNSFVRETHYANGDLQSSTRIETSADGRQETQVDDYDGNGIADRKITTETRGDGVTVETTSTFDEAGRKYSTFVIETSADGLETIMQRGDAFQTITRSAINEDSYTWDNGIKFGLNTQNVNVTHEMDASGIETWTLVTSVRVSETYTHQKNNGDTETRTRQVDKITTETARLDAETKAEILTEAARLYDTILDRDMDFEEIEGLVKYIEGNTLKADNLAANLLGHAEFSARYGSGSNVEFITQIHLNSFGRAPSLDELDSYLGALNSGTYTRSALAIELAESSEHIATGNWHMKTNNLDVIMNPAQFERSLDKARVMEQIKNLVDVAYDRDATAQELAYLCDRLMNEDDTLEDVAAELLSVGGEIFGVYTNSLKGLNNNDLVTEAFQNAFGRNPSNDERATWVGHLDNGRLSKAQFVASLAQSTEYLAEGNSHQSGPISTGNIINGTSGTNLIIGTDGSDIVNADGGNDLGSTGDGADQITGGAGNDNIHGSDGSDTYYWSKGDGNDTFTGTTENYTETDTIVLTDVLSTGVALTRESGQGTFRVTIMATGEYLTLGKDGIEALQFSDGTTWNLEEIHSRVRLDGDATNNSLSGASYRDNMFGGAGNDTLDGNDGDDHLTGGLGGDTLRGDAGSDTYHWSKGDGDDIINETEASYDDIDRLILTDVDPSDVLLSRSSANGATELQIKIISTGEIIHITNQLKFVGTASGGLWGGSTSSGPQGFVYGIEVIEFADGTLWGRDEIGENTRVSGSNGQNNTINGTNGDDFIDGKSGNDTLNGKDGDDRLTGGLGDDTLNGGKGSDDYVWSPGDGDDVINDTGNEAAEIDALYFGTGIKPSDVQLTLSGGGANTGGIFGAFFSSHKDLIITINHLNGSGEIIVKNFQDGNGHEGIEEIRFLDGTVWDLDMIRSKAELNGSANNDTLFGTVLDDTINGLDGNDTLDGKGGDDIITGGSGADTLNGGEGNDRYVWSKNDGDDLIEDSTRSLSDIDTLHLTDVSPGDINLSVSGDDLLILIISTGEVITISNAMHPINGIQKGVGIENILFADGSLIKLNEEGITATTHTGTAGNESLTGGNGRDIINGLAGNDTLKGYAGDDVLIGGAGNDTMYGGASGSETSNGNDTYIWAKGDGNDTIYDGGKSTTELDRLILSDVTANDVRLERLAGEDDLVITIISTGETITSLKQYYSTAQRRGLEIIEFADGTIWGLDKILSETVLEGDTGNNSLKGLDFGDNLNGLAGNDTLKGYAGDDVLTGGLGNDQLYGGGSSSETSNGNDTYIWAKGDGNDTIYDGGKSTTELDRLILSDVTANDVRLERLAGEDDLIITIVSTGETITSLKQYYATAQRRGLEIIEFADGTIWGMDKILSETVLEGDTGNNSLYGTGFHDNLYGLDGNDTLNGKDGDDVLIGGLGNDILRGGISGSDSANGNDTYVWSKGDGNDTIFDDSNSMLETDRLKLVDVTSNDVRLERLQGSMHTRIVIVSTGEVITDQYRHWSANEGNGLEEIEFSDGVVWSLEDILAQTVTEGTTGNNTLSGYGNRDNLYGLDGNDTLNGKGGDDVLIGGLGNDTLTGGAGDDFFVLDANAGTDTITDYNVSDDTVKFEGFTFADLTITQNGSDTEIAYGNGNVVTLEDVLASDMIEGEFQFA